MKRKVLQLTMPAILLLGLSLMLLAMPVFAAAPGSSVQGVGAVLLVDDDDNSPDVRGYYTDALDALGVAYNVWDTEDSDNEPTAAELDGYSTVIWFTGDSFDSVAGPSAETEAALASWLGAGNRCFFMSSQDYLWARGLTAFGASHLGIESFTSDVTQTTVTGAGPFAGLGPYALIYPFSNFSDTVNPTASAEVAFSGNVGNAAVSFDSGIFRTTFWGFPIEAIPAADQVHAMQAALSYCGISTETGIIAGTVTDAESGDPIAGALVSAVDGLTFSRTTDASGSYAFIVSVGTYDLGVTAAGYFSESDEGVEVLLGETVVRDFALGPAFAELQYSPGSFEQSLVLGQVISQTMLVSNTGTLAFDFSLRDFETTAIPRPVRSALPISQHFDQPIVQVPREHQDAMSTAGLNLATTQAVTAPLAAGDILASWPLGSLYGWGIGFDGAGLWISSPAPSWGGNTTFNGYGTDGTPTGVVHPYPWSPVNGPGDIAYNWNTGMLWVMDIGTGNCIHEMDPASGATGETICPGFSVSQRGLAYDPVSDTYFAGGWNDLTIHHFDATGTMLSQTSVGLAISGLAYNPDTQHLFVMVNASPNPIHVLDAANGFANLGQIIPAAGFGDFAGAGLEIDCDGNLWAVDQAEQNVYLIESGENAVLCGVDAPWLHQTPDSGTVGPGETMLVDVVFDATAVSATGTYTAEVVFNGNYTNVVARAPVVMHVTDNAAPEFDGAPYLFGWTEGVEIGTVSAVDPDGDTVSYSIIDGDSGGVFAIDADSGEITLVLPAAMTAGVVFNLTVQADDGNGATSTALVTVANDRLFADGFED